MSTNCERIKNLLLAGEKLNDAELEAHLLGCGECLQLKQDLLQLDLMFEELPEFEPTEAVTKQILAGIREVGTIKEQVAFQKPRNAVIAIAVLIALYVLNRVTKFATSQGALERTLSSAIEGSLGAFVLIGAIIGMLFVVPVAMFAPSPATRHRFRAFSAGLATVSIATFTLRSMTTVFFPSTSLSRPGIEVESASNKAPGGNEAYEDLIKYIADDTKNTQADRSAKEQRGPQEKMTGVISEIVNRIELLDEGLKKVENEKMDSDQPIVVAKNENRRERSEFIKSPRGSVGDKSGRVSNSEVANPVITEPESLAIFGADKEAKDINLESPLVAQTRTFIAPGDAVPIELLTSVSAPIDGTPYPVMFKLTGPISGPDGSALDLKDARVMASAQGSESDGRVMYRLSEIAGKNPDGSEYRSKIDGWVVGEDGIRGMRGKVVDKLGQTVLATMAQNQNSIENSADKDALKDSEVKVTQQLLDKYQKMIPVVEVKSGRDVVAVFSRGAEITVQSKVSEPVTPTPTSTNAWQNFLHERQEINNVMRQPANGYWQNTYLPGNASMRALQLSLEDSIARSTPVVSQLMKSVSELATKPVQPFDAPTTGALAIQLNADTKAVNGQQRVLLQIGIRGADQLNTTRQAIRQTVIVDLRNPTSQIEQEKIKSVLYAVNLAKELRDSIRFKFITSAGVRTIEPKELRYGTIKSEVSEIFSQSQDQSNQSLVNLVSQSVAALATDVTPESAFSAPSVLLVSLGEFGSEFDALSSVAYEGSLVGVPLTVISTGDSPNQSQIESLAIAGRGRGLQIESPDFANDIVRTELLNVGRVVAQAVRLNLKLAPGVELINVVDSKRLTEVETTEVKEAEQAVDKRLFTALSIPMDRGDDGDGIQIIIPAFYGGDSHVILIDAIAPNAGSIATLTAQFKDLVQLGNKKLQVSLALENGDKQLGLAEYGVIQNYLSLGLSSKLKLAAAALRNGDNISAEKILRDELELFQSVQQSVSTLERSSDVRSVIKLLTNGLALIETSQSQHVVGLSEVLEYASLRRVNDNTML